MKFIFYSRYLKMDFCLFGLNNFEVFQSFYSNYDIICVGRVGRPLRKFKAFSLLLTTLSDTREVESYILQFHGMNSILILLIIFLWISIPALYIHGFVIKLITIVVDKKFVVDKPWKVRAISMERLFLQYLEIHCFSIEKNQVFSIGKTRNFWK